MPGDFTGLGAGIGSALGGAIGELWAMADEQEREYLLQQAMDQYGSIDPKAISKIIETQMGRTEMDDVKGRLDPRLRDTEMAALSKLLEVGESDGLDAQALSKIDAAQSDAAQFERSQRGAIENDMAARGQLGSGNEMLSKLVAQQGGATRANRAGIEASADAETRALNAMMGAGNMAGNMRGQDLDMEMGRAGAQDSISKFNASMQHNANVYNADQENSVFDRQMGLANAKADRYDKQADEEREQADRKRKVATEGGRAVGSVAGMAAGAL